MMAAVYVVVMEEVPDTWEVVGVGDCLPTAVGIAEDARAALPDAHLQPWERKWEGSHGEGEWRRPMRVGAVWIIRKQVTPLVNPAMVPQE